VSVAGDDSERWSGRVPHVADDLTAAVFSPVIAEFSRQTLLLTMSSIMVERTPRLMPVACFCSALCLAGGSMGLNDRGSMRYKLLRGFRCDRVEDLLSEGAPRQAIKGI